MSELGCNIILRHICLINQSLLSKCYAMHVFIHTCVGYCINLDVMWNISRSQWYICVAYTLVQHAIEVWEGKMLWCKNWERMGVCLNQFLFVCVYVLLFFPARSEVRSVLKNLMELTVNY